MELFYRRYLCFISFLFLLTSLVVYRLDIFPKVVVLICVAVLLILSLIALIADRKRRFYTLFTFLSTLAVTIAIFNSLMFISLPAQKSVDLIGRYTAELEILSCEYQGENSSEYNVRVLQAEGEEYSVKAYLSCDASLDWKYGDRIIAVVDGESVDIKSLKQIDKDILLFLELDVTQPVMYAEHKPTNPFSIDALRYVTKSLRNSLCEYIDTVFGEDSPLVKGMLINEKSDISTFTKSQFRRAGASHLLAVSGLHISLLLGSADILLKKLYVSRYARIVIIAIGGALLLALTDFSASAVRAVLMLFAVYLAFLLSEESDAVTSLFVAVALITLISPFSIADIGMWLSFSATLGLVTVYPFLDRRFSTPKKEKRRGAFVLRTLIVILKALMLTLVANVFVLPLMWYFFGEFSLSSLPCNLFLSPLSAIFLPLCVLALALSWIPFLNTGLLFCAKLVEHLLLYVVGVFSGSRGATVSLEYPFVSVLVIAFSISMGILMLLRLRQKLWICVPAAVFVLSFAVCLTVFSLTSKTEIKYAGRKNDEIILADKAGRVSVCDLTDASAGDHILVHDSVSPYSVEIENYVIVSLKEGHAQMLERLYQNTLIRSVYIPIDSDLNELKNAKDVCEVAYKYDSKIVFYQSGHRIELFEDLVLLPFFDIDNGNITDVGLSFYTEESFFAYSDASQSHTALSIGAQSRYFLLGRHGKEKEGVIAQEYDFSNTELILADKATSHFAYDVEGYILPSKEGKRSFVLSCVDQ